MIRFAWRLIRSLLMLPSLVIMGVAVWYCTQHYKIPFTLALFDGKSVLRVFEVQRSGDAYIGRRYTLTDKNHFYISSLRGLDIGSLSEGEPHHIVLPNSATGTLIDIALMVEPIKIHEIRQDEEDHYLSISLGGSAYFTTVPEQQRAAAVLARTLFRFSRPEADK